MTAIRKRFVRSFMLSILGIGATIICLTDAWANHNQVPCSRCHKEPADASEPYTADDLVQPRDLICLSCHDGSYDALGLDPPRVVNGSKELAGGSFTPTLVFDGAGHNVLNRDGALGLTPPGGSPLEGFQCLSCHDAHDNGNYRNLKKAINGYTTLVAAHGDPEFRQTVYLSGINDFCGACHEDFYSAHDNRAAGGWRRHPVGITIGGAENADLDHWSRVPDRVTRVEYPSGYSDDIHGARVMCLSCHRAHASAYKNAMRWDHSRKPSGCLECHPF